MGIGTVVGTSMCSFCDVARDGSNTWPTFMHKFMQPGFGAKRNLWEMILEAEQSQLSSEILLRHEMGQGQRAVFGKPNCTQASKKETKNSFWKSNLKMIWAQLPIDSFQWILFLIFFAHQSWWWWWPGWITDNASALFAKIQFGEKKRFGEIQFGEI